MVRRLLIFGLVLSACVSATTPAKQPEYNVNVHVSASRTVKHSESSPRYQYLNVIIDGRKYELESVLGIDGLLAVGDYKARLSTDDHKHGGSDILQLYEFQLRDKWTREFLVVGQSE
jgi:hypothetical protein